MDKGKSLQKVGVVLVHRSSLCIIPTNDFVDFPVIRVVGKS